MQTANQESAPQVVGTIHDQFCRCRQCKPPYDAARPSVSHGALRAMAIMAPIGAVTWCAVARLAGLL